MGYFKLLSLHVGGYTAPLDCSFSKSIQVNAEPAVTSKRVKTLLGCSFWWYQLMGFSWLRVKIRRNPCTEAGFKNGSGEGQ